MTDIMQVDINEEGVEIIKREKSNLMYLCNPPRPHPDRVWKEVYRVVNGKLVLVKTVKGKHIPEQAIPESFDFTEPDPNTCPGCGCHDLHLDERMNEMVCNRCGLVISMGDTS